MTEWDHAPAWAAEFPNDNPLLHEGASWVCLSVCGPVKPITRPRTAASRPLRAFAEVLAIPPPEALPPPLVATSEETKPPLLEVPQAIAEAAAAPVDRSEALCESVLTVLLDRLDLDFTPELSPVDDVLAIDASDLDVPVSATLEPASLVESAPVVFDETDVSDGAAEALVEVNLTSELTGLSDGEDAVNEPESEGVVAESEVAPVVAESAPAVAESEVSPAVAESAPAVAESEVSPAVAELELAPVVAESAPVVAMAPAVAESATAIAEPEPADAHSVFVAALVQVLLASGATRSAAVLPSLLEAGTVDDGLLDGDAIRDLGSAKIAVQSSGRISLTADFVATARAWREVLRGQSNDLSACGTSTLDGWAADLLRALGVGREGRVDVRRELRRRGVAAFGMLHAA